MEHECPNLRHGYRTEDVASHPRTEKQSQGLGTALSNLMGNRNSQRTASRRKRTVEITVKTMKTRKTYTFIRWNTLSWNIGRIL